MMRTKRAVARDLMQELKAAYVAIDAEPYGPDPDAAAQAIGRYDGLKLAYVLLTGRNAQDVGFEVVTWYVGTDEYQVAKKKHYGRLCSVCGDEADGDCAACDRPLCEEHRRTTAVPGDSFCRPGEGCSPEPFE